MSSKFLSGSGGTENSPNVESSGPGIKVADTPLVNVPTTEQLVDLEKEIQRLIEKKRKTDLYIIDLEARIHAVETEYLKETSQFGALFNGLEGYLGGSSSTSQPVNGRRHGIREVRDSDRVFSSTSSSYPRALAVHSRLVREHALNPVDLKRKSNTTTTDTILNNRKRRQKSDSTWTTSSNRSSRIR